MAKRKTKNRDRTYRSQAMRDLHKVATSIREVRLPKSTTISPLIEDRRTLPHAIRDEVYRDLSGTPAQISYGTPDPPRPPVQGLPERMYHRFETPRRVPVCIRRETRRRVLFALRRSGKASGRSRRAQWTAKSYIRCK